MNIKGKEYTKEELFEILEKCKSLSDAATLLFSKQNYTNREKIKNICNDIGFDWNQHILDLKEQNKKFCKCCNKELTKKQKKFCSSSCAAKTNNLGVTRNKKKMKKYDVNYIINSNIEKNLKFCVSCNKELCGKMKYYCSNICQRNFEYKQYIERWKQGLENGIKGNHDVSGYIRRYLHEKYDNKCQGCGWSKIHPITDKVPLQIHHKDGDCINNKEENLELLCPNCHSLTETFGNLNKDSKRINRHK